METIAEAQAEKAKQLGLQGPSESGTDYRRARCCRRLSGGDGIYPWFGSIYNCSGMGLGVGFLKRLEKAASVNIQSGLSLNNSMLLRGAFAAPELWRGMLQVERHHGRTCAACLINGQDSAREARDWFDYTPVELGGRDAEAGPFRVDDQLHDAQLRHAPRHPALHRRWMRPVSIGN